MRDDLSNARDNFETMKAEARKSELPRRKVANPPPVTPRSLDSTPPLPLSDPWLDR